MRNEKITFHFYIELVKVIKASTINQFKKKRFSLDTAVPQHKEIKMALWWVHKLIFISLAYLIYQQNSEDESKYSRETDDTNCA